MEWCKDCKYYKGSGLCHRYPPSVIVYGGRITLAYPDVKHQDACGEFVQREKK